MARRTTIKPLQQMSEINMTPLIDLTFLLLITFIITMPLVEQGIPINLPKGQSQNIDQTQARSITVDVEGQVYLDRVPVSMEALASEIGIIAAAAPETPVMVRADEKLHYGKVVEILRILNQANITRMALVTTPDK
ncbi:MAG TPA: biopolymer transporter ExbD [Kiritimatiellia bacterium]|nr:biopolymer transporter ExbD [Kiritimatiellia bacterium]HMO98799.1 biopolymer transporter ExbD [Kiritimatiellia bacterium]HMP96868.1 biopolymer transporter ExbD [Kiritimatiellia bacterium]